MSVRQNLDIGVEDVGNDGLLISLPGPVKSGDDRERAETGRENVQSASEPATWTRIEEQENLIALGKYLVQGLRQEILGLKEENTRLVKENLRLRKKLKAAK